MFDVASQCNQHDISIYYLILHDLTNMLLVGENVLAKKYCHFTYIYIYIYFEDHPLLKKKTHTHFLPCLFTIHLLKKTNFYNLIYDRIGKKGLCKIHANDEILVTNQ